MRSITIAVMGTEPDAMVEAWDTNTFQPVVPALVMTAEGQTFITIQLED